MNKEKIFTIVTVILLIMMMLYRLGEAVEIREKRIQDKNQHIITLKELTQNQQKTIEMLEVKNKEKERESNNNFQNYIDKTEENEKLNNEINNYINIINNLEKEKQILEEEKVITEKLNELNAVEWNALYRVARAEAGPNVKQALKNVVYVILNRVNSKRFENDIMEVIFAKKQFAGTKVDKFWTFEITDEVIQTVQEAYLDYNPEVGEYCAYGALFFHQLEWSETFSGAKYIFTDEIGHHFYKYEEE